MLLSVQQKYILEILRRTGCIRRRQLFPLVREKFRPMGVEISEHRLEVMLRQPLCGRGPHGGGACTPLPCEA